MFGLRFKSSFLLSIQKGKELLLLLLNSKVKEGKLILLASNDV